MNRKILTTVVRSILCHKRTKILRVKKKKSKIVKTLTLYERFSYHKMVTKVGQLDQQ